MIDQLPDRYGQTLCLNVCDGKSQQAIASELNLSFSGVKSSVQRARKMLKDMLTERCHFEFDAFGTIIDFHPISCCCCSQYRMQAV